VRSKISFKKILSKFVFATVGIKTSIKLIFLFLIFSILFALPYILIPPQVKSENPSEYNGVMLIFLLLTQFFSIVYLIKRLHLSGLKLFLTVTIIFWGLQTCMTQIETWYFREAMPTITNVELRNLFLRPLISSITFIPLAVWVLDQWNNGISQSEKYQTSSLNVKEISMLSIAYVVIYFLFGYFIAWQFETVRIFYSGSPDNAGFIEQIKQTLETKRFILLFQFFRGFLWIIMGLPILLYLGGSKIEKIMACIILYSLPAIQLTVDNPFMPQQVRIAHLLEVSASNGLFGLLIGYIATRRN
jgi:hypothetical protein